MLCVYFHVIEEREDLMLVPKANGVASNLTFNSKKQEDPSHIVPKKFSQDDDTTKGLAAGM